MLHIYAIVLAVILLVGALAAIIICICVDIVPIIKSRGSTLVSRDSVTQEQARMLKKSLQRNKLTTSASADFLDSMQGRKSRAQALRKSERPRFGSTPLSLLTGEDEKDSDVEIKTTTVIIEALPKSKLSEDNDDADCDANKQTVSETNEMSANNGGPDKGPSHHSTRANNLYTENKPSKLGRSGSSPNVAPNSSDIPYCDVHKGAMTYNSRDPRANNESEHQLKSYPNSPNIRATRPPEMTSETTPKSTPVSNHVTDPYSPSKRQFYPRQGTSLSYPDNNRGYPPDNREHPPQALDSHHCKWCQMERENCAQEQTHERPLPFRRTESFPENFGATSSPHITQKYFRRQRSFDEDEAGRISREFPYDRNKYCKTPHQGYSPCPDCFHGSNRPPYYPYVHHERGSPTGATNMGVTATGVLPKVQLPPLISSASSSSSSGSSTRFRLLRQPLEDIQEDASDCYAMREAEVTSTIDSRELDSSPDDETMPKSTDNSESSVSPIETMETQQTLVTAAGS